MQQPLSAGPRRAMSVGARRLLVLLSLVAACRDDTKPPITAPPVAAAVASVSINASRQVLAPGDSVRYTARAFDADGRVLPTATIAWTSSDPQVATISATGMVAALTAGSATITATAEGQGASVELSVGQSQLCECLRIIDSAAVTLADRNDSTGIYRLRVLRGAPPAIDSGSIIVGAEAGGYLRRVHRVTQAGPLLTLETTQAYLEEAVQEGEFATTSPSDGEVVFEEPVEESQGGQGATRWGAWRTTYVAPELEASAASGRGTRLNGLGFRLQVSPTPQTPIRVDFTVKEGTFAFAPPLDIGAKFRFFQLQSMRAIFRSQADLVIDKYELKVTGALTTSALKLATESKRFLVKQRPFATFIGPMPLVGILTATFKLQVTPIVGASAVFTGDFKTGYGVAAGIRWSRDNGWTPVSSSTRPYFSASAPQFQSVEGTASVRIAVVPELSLQLYGVAGPFVNLEPYAEAAATAALGFAEGEVGGLDWETRVSLGLNLNIGAKLSAFGRKDLAEAKFIIPLVQPYKLVRDYSDGPLTVRTRISGDDAPSSVRVRLRPAFVDTNPPFGRDLGNSVGERVIAAGHSTQFDDVRSGRKYPHTVAPTALAGNCSADRPRDTVVVASKAYILVGGTAAEDTIAINCVALGALAVRVRATGDDIVTRPRLTLARLDTAGTGKATTPLSLTMPGGLGARDTVVTGLVPANPGSGATGMHRVTLDPGRRNCAVAAPSMPRATVTSGDTALAEFRLSCVRRGHVVVMTATTDPDPAPGLTTIDVGTQVVPRDTLDGTGEPAVRVAATGSVVIDSLIPVYSASGASGRHTVQLTDVPSRCREAGGVQRAVTVFPGDTARAVYALTCVERFHLLTRSTGPGTDVDGYLALIHAPDGSIDSVAVGVAGATAIPGLAVGTHRVELAGVDGSCLAPAPVLAQVGARDSTSVTFTVSCPGPAAPSGLRATAIGVSSVDLTWNAPASGATVAHYRITRSTTGSPVTTTILDSLSTLSLADSGLGAFTRFVYRVASVDRNGLVGPSSGPLSVRTRDGTPPSPPTSLSAVLASASSASLQWSAARDPESGVVRYRVFRDGTLIDSTSSTAYVDRGLAPFRTFTYRVEAVNGDGQQSARSVPASVATLDATPPSAPSNLTATVSGLQVALAWTPAADPESGVGRYIIYRDGVRIGTSAITSARDSGLTAGDTYTYEVAAENGEGLQGARSTPAVVTIPTTQPVGDLQVQVRVRGANVPTGGLFVEISAGAVTQRQAVTPNGHVTFSAIVAQPWSVLLQGIPGHCALRDGTNPRTLSVSAGTVRRTTFDLVCQ
ncbi:MAG: fibronectin type III domain-containing protein [Gemmatimonadetes bacterium]|nr:fibronectin type III domain-containing protein [Gemmatimonadota bacterium]